MIYSPKYKHKHQLVSVVIPIYNTPYKIFVETLASVLNQTHKKLEIIIVDDGSNIDIELDILNIKDKRICYYKLSHTNANIARNYGIKKSSAKYIAMLDSDDIWLINHIELSLTTLIESCVDGIYSGLYINKPNSPNYLFTSRDLKEGETMIDYLLFSGYGAQTSTLFMTKESALNVLWDEHLKRHQDYDFVVRYSQTYKLISKRKPTTIYRLSSSPKTIDFNSCIKFIERNINDISLHIYIKYTISMLNASSACRAQEQIINYYFKELQKYTQLL